MTPLRMGFAVKFATMELMEMIAQLFDVWDFKVEKFEYMLDE